MDLLREYLGPEGLGRYIESLRCTSRVVRQILPAR